MTALSAIEQSAPGISQLIDDLQLNGFSAKDLDLIEAVIYGSVWFGIVQYGSSGGGSK
jgi:hypothetical protein